MVLFREGRYSSIVIEGVIYLVVNWIGLQVYFLGFFLNMKGIQRVGVLYVWRGFIIEFSYYFI